MEKFTVEERAHLRREGIVVSPTFRVGDRWNNLAEALYHMVRQHQETQNPVYEKAIMHLRWTQAFNTCLAYEGFQWSLDPVLKKPQYSSRVFKNEEEWIDHVQFHAEQGCLLSRKAIHERARHRFKAAKKPAKEPRVWPQ